MSNDKSILIDRIINYQEVIKDFENILITNYNLDYGKIYQRLISTRLRNTTYFLESPPDITYTFLNDSSIKIPQFLLEQLDKEYPDYLEVKKRINSKINSQIYQRINKYLPSKEKKLDFLALINLLTNNFTHNLSYSELVEKTKNNFKELSSHQLTKLYQDIINIIDYYYKQLYQQTLYGKRVYNTLQEETKKAIPLKDYLDTMTYPYAHCFYPSYRIDKITSKIVLIPLLKMYLDGMNLDHLFLHETRHIAETGPNGIGIDLLKDNSKLELANELRTEKHALNDLATLPLIFSKENNLAAGEYEFSLYENLFPTIEPLLEDYHALFDECAIKNDLQPLKQIFTRRYLYSYGKMLNKISADLMYQVETAKDDSDIFLNAPQIGKILTKMQKQAQKKIDNN